MTRFNTLFPASSVLIGMIHLPPLPGYPGSPGIERIIRHAIGDTGFSSGRLRRGRRVDGRPGPSHLL